MKCLKQEKQLKLGPWVLASISRLPNLPPQWLVALSPQAPLWDMSPRAPPPRRGKREWRVGLAGGGIAAPPVSLRGGQGPLGGGS